MMARNWLQLEAIQEFWDEHKLNREQLIVWENQYPQHKESIVHPLYELNEPLEDRIIDLFSYVETTVRIRSLMPDGESSVIELDERYSKQTAAYDTLNAALSNLREKVRTVKECLDDPLGSVQKVQLRLDAAHKRNERLDREFRDLQVQYTEAENCLCSRGELEDHIEVLESSVKEKDTEIAHISRQNDELRNSRNPQKIAEAVTSPDNLTTSNKSNIIEELEKEKRDLLEQLERAIGERDDKHRKWLTARKDKEIMREETENMRNVFISNEHSRGKLLEENTALCEQVVGLKAQCQPASSYTHTAGRSTSIGSLQPSRSSTTQVPREEAVRNRYAGLNAPSTPVRQSSSSFGNRNYSAISPARSNNRRISSASPFSRTRPTLTRTQERVIATVQHLRDDQLERLESDGAFESVSIKVPGQGHHWVKGHWRRNRGTSFYESNEEV